jgi:photosystem II stability/assembly factor-like uncharacterized protein
MRTRALIPAVAVAAAFCLPATTPTATAGAGGVWTPTIEATQGFDHLSAFGNGVFYAQYLDSYAKSTDAGLTWTVMPRPPRQYLGSAGIRFATPAIGYSVNGSGVGLGDTLDPGGLMPLHRTTDGGKTWRAVCVPKSKITDNPYFSPGSSPLSLGRDGKTVMLVGGERYTDRPSPACGQEQDLVLTSHDSGAHWTRAALPRGWYLGYREQVYDANTMALLEYKFSGDGTECSSSTVGLFLSRDGGRSFQKKYVCTAMPSCTSVAMVTSQRIILGRSDGSTLVSKDGGETFAPGQRLFDAQWQPAIDAGQMNPSYFWVQSLSFADAKHGFASTRGSGTWRTTDGGVSWTQERSHECEFFLWGIGEIAAGSPTTAITGGPHFISARLDTPLPQEGCTPKKPQNIGAYAWQSLDGSAAIRGDGTVVAGR